MITAEKTLNRRKKGSRIEQILFDTIQFLIRKITPLRDRKEDIDVLTKYFLKNHSDSLGEDLRVLSKEVMDAIKNFIELR